MWCRLALLAANYRFVSRQLILHDTRANVILDRIPDAIECPALGMTGR
jgi:hypothetical protein